MSKVYPILSILVLFLLIGVGVSLTSASAGTLVPCDTENCCMGFNCTVICADETEGFCNGDEGTGDADVFCGSDQADTINAGGGDDIVCAGKGMDTVNGEAGEDDISGGKDDDTINGGENDDYLDGGMGDDTINGDAGDDIIEGGKGEDTIDGGTDDVLGDECYGGPQTDTFAGCECGEVGPTNGRSPENGTEDPTLLEECELPI